MRRSTEDKSWRYLWAIHLTFICLLAGSCTILEPEPNIDLDVGQALVTIQGTSVVAVADMRRMSHANDFHDELTIQMPENRKLVFRADFLVPGNYRLNEVGDSDIDVYFQESGRLWIGVGGIVDILSRTDFGLVGYAKLTMIDLTSSCYGCEGTRMRVDARFHAAIPDK